MCGISTRSFFKQLICLLIFTIIISTVSMYGQVTIGSPLKPRAGALLELKENDNLQANSTKGLNLPRVSLENASMLKPMLTDSESADVDMRKSHIGLMVFNVNENNGFCKGPYVWSGEVWLSLKNCLELTVDANTIQFPSNAASGVAPSRVLNINWKPLSASPVMTLSSVAGYSPVQGYTPTASPTGGSLAENIQITAMSQAEVAVNPFLEKASRLDISLTGSNKTVTESVLLRQINYALTYTKEPYYLMDGSTYSFKVKSNAKWKAELTDTGGGVVTSLLTTAGGTGEGAVETNVSFTVPNDMTNPTKFLGTAKIRFYSEESQFADVVVDLLCASGSIVGKANAYIVKPSTAILIPVSQANADGTTRITAAETYTAGLVWTDNVNRVAANSNIRMILPAGTGSAGYLFVAAGTAEGNAMVSAVKTGGAIAWSWHIWILNEDPTANTITNNGLVFMDRNLGATTAVGANVNSFGLYYQWGRKDPLPGTANIASLNPAQRAIYNSVGSTTMARNSTASGSLNISTLVANPLTFYMNLHMDDTSWGYGTTKSAYDPCPENWRVATFVGTTSPWNGLTALNTTWNETNKGRTINGNFWPAGGRMQLLTAGDIFYYVAQYGGYWTDRPYLSNTIYSYSLNFYSAAFDPAQAYDKAHGLSVRCVRIP